MKKAFALLFALLLLAQAALAQTLTPGEPLPQETILPAESAAPAQTQAPLTGKASLGSMEVVSLERKETITLAVPVEFSVGGEKYYSNMLSSGSIVAYDKTRSAVGYSADIVSVLSSLTVEIAQKDDRPFVTKSIPSRRTIVGRFSDATAAELGFEKKNENGAVVYRDPQNGRTYAPGDVFCAGFGVFANLQVSGNVPAGTCEIPVKIRWESEQFGSGSAEAFVQAVVVASSDTSSKSTGGGGGGYYGGTNANTPTAKLVIQKVSTSPENPVAGQEFDLLVQLRNTSETAAVSNITLSCEAEGDAVLPVSGAFSAYIDAIAPGKSFEQSIRVRAQSDIPDAPVRIYTTIDYEDKNANAHSVTQTVVVSVSQLMRIKIDDPVLPGDAPIVGESYPVTMGVFNLGKTTLYNVTVQAVDDTGTLSTGASFYCGNMESGTSKTAEMRLTPLTAGAATAELVVTYENSRGEVFSQSRAVSLYAQSYDEDEWLLPDFDDEPTAPPPPAPGQVAMEIAAMLPWWMYAVVGSVFLLVVASIGTRVRRRRIRAMEEDALD